MRAAMSLLCPVSTAFANGSTSLTVAKLGESLTGMKLGILRFSNSEAVKEQFGDVAAVRSYDNRDNLMETQNNIWRWREQQTA